MRHLAIHGAEQLTMVCLHACTLDALECLSCKDAHLQAPSRLACSMSSSTQRCITRQAHLGELQMCGMQYIRRSIRERAEEVRKGGKLGVFSDDRVASEVP